MNDSLTTKNDNDNDSFQQDYATPPKPTGKRYNSVSELMAGEKIPSEIQESVSRLGYETRLVQKLAVARERAGINQEEMAKVMGYKSQSAISKLESSQDKDLTIGEIAAYAKASDERISIDFGKPLNHVQSVKLHARKIRDHLSALAHLAHKDEDLETAIQAFFGEAFFNLLSILSECQGEMPNSSALEVRMEIGDSARPGRKGA